MAKPSAPTMSRSERDYRDEDDHRTLQRAGEICADKSRMAGAKRYQRKATKSLSQAGKFFGGRR